MHQTAFKGAKHDFSKKCFMFSENLFLKNEHKDKLNHLLRSSMYKNHQTSLMMMSFIKASESSSG